MRESLSIRALVFWTFNIHFKSKTVKVNVKVRIKIIVTYINWIFKDIKIKFNLMSELSYACVCMLFSRKIIQLNGNVVLDVESYCYDLYKHIFPALILPSFRTRFVYTN